MPLRHMTPSGHQIYESVHHPRRGIDAFLALHAGEYEHLSKTAEQYQMILRKTSEMRIGFLVEQSAERHFASALGLGIYLVLAIDTSYAMAAAVTIRSAIEKTTGRMTIYIVDCDICAEDKEKIKSSLPKRHDVTLVFLDLPTGSLAAELGVAWAKVDMMKILPVEQALYLDADMLVRRSLEELWNTTLEGSSIGAAMDVGFPMGHEGVSRRRYFNAGMLLIDLADARTHLSELAARGLGTYAEISSADRDIPALGDMKGPGVLHFTGPVYPSLVVVLNPFVQPYTSKPWGYAGAPGHPFKDEWRVSLNETAWAGWQGGRDRHNTMRCCEGEKQKAIQDSIKKFETRSVAVMTKDDLEVLAVVRNFLSKSPSVAPPSAATATVRTNLTQIAAQSMVSRSEFSTSAGSVPLDVFPFFSRLVFDEYEELSSEAAEVARICANKSVTKTSGKDSFYMRVRVYPFHIIFIDKMLSYADANRFTTRASCWYTRCWGKLYDTVARVNIGEIILPICYKELNAAVTQEALRRARYKFPS
ncbi:uncharacterized protein HD556DRAFT_1533648 [Suillus plorans]|uniref:Glycosyltransferase family 8 protein n=1 Tax=Suillus plorans TaxID=116603 RepID=A0A9P7DSX6_9AGAM|nr:uncharacterized protein HD556DRAFT_1533648 [Suillus plorans]KAG1802209.1 hypothetical protein HD556DRAFT_1533648 [Suillus plorans]